MVANDDGEDEDDNALFVPRSHSQHRRTTRLLIVSV